MSLQQGAVNTLQGVSFHNGVATRWLLDSRSSPFSFSPRLPSSIQFAANGPLGGTQTTPRAELLAVVTVIANASFSTDIVVVTDALLIVAGIGKGEEATTGISDLRPLWRLFWHVLKRRTGDTHFLWVKAHGDQLDVSTCGWRLHPDLLWGNAIADRLADNCAEDVQLPHWMAARPALLALRLRHVLWRFVCVARRIKLAFPARVKGYKPLKTLKPPSLDHESMANLRGHSLIPTFASAGDKV